MIMISSLLLLGLACCGGSQAGSYGATPGSVPGWEKTSYSTHHAASDLHEYLNGGAAKYLAYSILDLHVQEYARQNDGFVVTLELYRMDSCENAFGVYSCDSGGQHPGGIGEQASYGSGLLQFWQGHHFLRVQAQDPSGDPSGPVLEFGRAVSKGLESWSADAAERRERRSGGTGRLERDRSRQSSPLPELAASMPSERMIPDSLCFFHTQISLNSLYYLSEKNILELSPDTDAVSAEYHTSSRGIARVIAVCYPDSTTARRVFNLIGDAAQSESTAASHNPVVFTGLDGRLLVLVLEAPTQSDASELGDTVLAAARCEGGKRQEGHR